MTTTSSHRPLVRYPVRFQQPASTRRPGNTTDFTFPNSGDHPRRPHQLAGRYHQPPARRRLRREPARSRRERRHRVSPRRHHEHVPARPRAVRRWRIGLKGRVLAAPKITTQSNVAASIQSGRSIPVQTIANNTITTDLHRRQPAAQRDAQVTAENTIVLKIRGQQLAGRQRERRPRRRRSTSGAPRPRSRCRTVGPRSSALTGPAAIRIQHHLIPAQAFGNSIVDFDAVEFGFIRRHETLGAVEPRQR